MVYLSICCSLRHTDYKINTIKHDSSSFKNIHCQISSPLVHFNVKNCIGKMGKIVKNEIFASTSVLSYLDGEMIKVFGLGTYMG